MKKIVFAVMMVMPAFGLAEENNVYEKMSKNVYEPTEWTLIIYPVLLSTTEQKVVDLSRSKEIGPYNSWYDCWDDLMAFTRGPHVTASCFPAKFQKIR